jgi:LPS-assembly protein
MDLLHSFPEGKDWRLFAAALALFLALVGNSHAQQTPGSLEPPGPAVSILRYRGKEVLIRADSEQKDKDVYHLRGHVQIAYEGMRVTADEASYDDTTGDIMARGHVVFDDPKSHLVAEEVHYNIETQKGWFTNGAGYVRHQGTPGPRVLRTENPFYIWGRTVDRLDENTYLVDHGQMTTCDCAKKGWLLSARRARVTVDDKAVAHDAVLRLLGLPIFYFPLVADSIASEPRQTGFLLPHIGNSSQKGYIVGDGFFWAITPSADLMFGAEDYSKRGLAEKGEFRAKPSQNADFTVNYFGVNDKYSGTTEVYNPATGSYTTVSLAAPGRSIYAFGKDDDIGEGFRAVANFDYVNTMAFRLTWSPNYTEAVSSEAEQSGFVTKNWDAYSFNVSAERYENFLSTLSVPGNAVVIRHLPSFQLTGEDRQVSDSPFYFSFETSVDGVGRTQPGLTLPLPLLGDRLDFHPQFLLRPKEFWHFRFTPMFGFRATDYSISYRRNSVDRLLAEVGLDLRPPALEKVLSKSYWGYRIKHVIEPDIQYQLVRARDPENILDIIRFDPMDIFTETNAVEYSLTNSLLARQDVPANSPDMPPARDIFSWRIAQKYYFDPTFGGALVSSQTNVFASTIDFTGFAFDHGQKFSPIDSVFKFAPFSNYDTEVRTDINPSGGVLDAGITSHVRRGSLGVSVSDFFVNHASYLGLTSATAGLPPPLTAFNMLDTVVTFGDTNRKGLNGAVGMDYNFQQKIFQHSVTQLSYNFGCFAINVEYQYYNLGPLRIESQFRIALALANVGTFGNLRPRERLALGTTTF